MLQNFQDHQFSYERAHYFGLFVRGAVAAVKNIYGENQTESFISVIVQLMDKRK
jgi:hypothetical protein